MSVGNACAPFLGFVCDLRQAPIDPRSTVIGRRGHIDLEYSERPFGKHFAHERHRDVEYRHAFGRAPLRLAVMRVSVKDRGDWIAAKRLFKAAASQERKDLERLSL